MTADERRAAWILAAIAAAEGTWCVVNLAAIGARRFADYLGLLHGGAGIPAWLAALAVATAYSWFAARLPSVRANLVRPSTLKLLGLAVAVTAGVCEEAVFRKLLMNGVAHAGRGIALQIVVSALAFGLAHAVWGLVRGSVGAALGAMIATGGLGALLAGVFVLGHRVLAPCVAAHLVINAFAEPGLVLAAVRGEMSRRRPSPAPAPDARPCEASAAS